MPNIRTLIEYDAAHPEKAGSNLEEKLFLFGLLRMLKPETVIEVGVSAGHMTCWLALALHINDKGNMVSVDNFSKRHGGQASSSDVARSRLAANDLGSCVSFVKSDSVEFMKSIADDTFDFVWIDGDHSFDGARADIKEGMRIAKDTIAVHDTNQQYDGPRKAIASLNGPDGGYWVHGCRGIWMRNIK